MLHEEVGRQMTGTAHCATNLGQVQAVITEMQQKFDQLEHFTDKHDKMRHEMQAQIAQLMSFVQNPVNRGNVTSGQFNQWENRLTGAENAGVVALQRTAEIDQEIVKLRSKIANLEDTMDSKIAEGLKTLLPQVLTQCMEQTIQTLLRGEQIVSREWVETHLGPKFEEQGVFNTCTDQQFSALVDRLSQLESRALHVENSPVPNSPISTSSSALALIDPPGLSSTPSPK